jgi:hypothetical protein
MNKLQAGTVCPQTVKWKYSFLAAVFSLLACELILLITSHWFPLVKYHLSPPWTRNIIPDPVLGKRMSAYYPGHDGRGYRNQHALKSCDVLAIGDSMTYGYGAPPTGSWPYQLEVLSKRKVYNAGVGSYGPCEYEAVLDELLMLKPQVVIVGLYLANDIIDAYKAIYLEGRCGHLKSTEKVILSEIEKADKKATLREVAEKLGMEKQTRKFGERQQSREGQAVDSSFQGWLAERSSLYGLGRSALYVFSSRSGLPFREQLDDSFEIAAQRPLRIAFDAEPKFRTVFLSPELDFLAMDISDPRVREGFRIIQSVILSINSKLKIEGIRLIIVLIHNKPYVYSNILQKYWSLIPENLVSLITLEGRVTQLTAAFLRASGIVYVDTLFALRSQFIRGKTPYHESDDNHPNTTGYMAIAESLLPAVIGIGPQ